MTASTIAPPAAPTDSAGRPLPAWVTIVPIADEPNHVAAYDPVTGTEARYMDITPQLATQWLELYNEGKGNRRIWGREVRAFADDMRGDRWPFIADTITFGRDKAILFDGQHRLQSIVASGTTRRYLVVRGLVPEARPVIDGGKPRSLTDALTMSGAVAGESKHVNALMMSVTRRAAYWHVGEKLPSKSGGQNRVLTRLEIVGFAAPRIPELAHAARKGYNLYMSTKIPPSIAGFVYWLAEGVDADQASTFFEQIEAVARYRGEKLPENSPVKALLRRTSLNDKPKGRGNRPADEAAHLYLMLRSWVLWRSDRLASTIPLPWGRDGKPAPEHMPDPATVLPPLTGAAAASARALAAAGPNGEG